MKCEDIETMMMDYLENNIDDHGRKAIEKHLETCESCLDSLRDAQKLLKMIPQADMEIPDESLRINFYHMLHREMEKIESQDNKLPERQIVPWYSNKPFLVAAGIAILLCGTFLGTMMKSGNQNTSGFQKISQLETEVNDLRKNTMLTMLRDESSSQRLEGISYADDMQKPDYQIITALINTLNNDKNVNVRLASAYSLSKFTDDRMVCDSLIASLPKQEEPIIQITIINILVGIKEKNALKTIQKMLDNKEIINEVKVVAQNGARELML